MRGSAQVEERGPLRHKGTPLARRLRTGPLAPKVGVARAGGKGPSTQGGDGTAGAGRILDGVSTEGGTESRQHPHGGGARNGSRTTPVTRLAVAGAAWAVASVLAFIALDPIFAAFVVILALTVVVIGALAYGGRPQPSFDEREEVRARKRKAKWDAGHVARDKDRARWEAHQARKQRP